MGTRFLHAKHATTHAEIERGGRSFAHDSQAMPRHRSPELKATLPCITITHLPWRMRCPPRSAKPIWRSFKSGKQCSSKLGLCKARQPNVAKVRPNSNVERLLSRLTDCCPWSKAALPSLKALSVIQSPSAQAAPQNLKVPTQPAPLYWPSPEPGGTPKPCAGPLPTGGPGLFFG